MTDAREIIALANHCAADNASAHDMADAAVQALTNAGYRILGPDEVDLVTMEKCASIAAADGRRELSWAEMSLPVSPGPVIAKDRAAVSDRIASAIRALGRKT